MNRKILLSNSVNDARVSSLGASLIHGVGEPLDQVGDDPTFACNPKLGW